MKCQRSGCSGEIIDGICDDCGRPPIGEKVLPPVVQVSQSGASSSDAICPDCGTPNTDGDRFCQVCKYDFHNQASGVGAPVVEDTIISAPSASVASVALPIIQPPPIPAAPAPVVATTAAPLVATVKLNVVILVDPSLADEENRAQCPANEPERIFPLDLDENLVGRRSDVKGVFPEIMIDDPGISRRHLKFNKQPDGSFAVLELGSANGTKLNGSDLEAGIVTPVSESDELTLGMWTRLKLRLRG